MGRSFSACIVMHAEACKSNEVDLSDSFMFVLLDQQCSINRRAELLVKPANIVEKYIFNLKHTVECVMCHLNMSSGVKSAAYQKKIVPLM